MENIKRQFVEHYSLYTSQASATRAGQAAVAAKRADGFRVALRHQRNSDRSTDVGYVAQLLRGGQHVGFA